MNTTFQRITPFLWFDDCAEAAANFYVGMFDNARIKTTTRYTRESARTGGRPEGSVMTVAFELDGQDFTALNGGPVFQFSPAVSLVVQCRTQTEIDHYWNHLSEGGDKSPQQCGWLKDRYGLSWQIVPEQLAALLGESDPDGVRRVTQALMGMRKLDLAELQRAAGQSR